MKKQIIRVVVIAVAVILVAWHSPIAALITPEKTTSKNIQVEIYKAEAYTSAVYTEASAKLHVTVVKVRGNRRSIVWQKNYDAKLLSQYPARPMPSAKTS